MDIDKEHDTTDSHSNDMNLTDAHIQQLLADAEERLRKDTIDTANASSSTSRAEQALPNVPKLSASSSLQPYVHQHNDLAVIDTTRIAQPVVSSDNQSLIRNQPTSKKDKPTAGSDWFDLPQTELTPELKRDLQLLRMRSILDPKRHYKKENGKAQPPKYSQIGTIVEGPTEYFSGRIAKRDRKKTFVEEALVLERENKRFESRYKDAQNRKRSGKKAFYNNLRAKRQGGKNHG
ncbi:Fcf2 domain-containing protein [Aspergillus stella-maris]|uniref:Fcf2 domain-containing protein n=1 Tax=Aspergillus stella-maris TaxID=1810926 RepID=UPI003CCD736A